MTGELEKSSLPLKKDVYGYVGALKEGTLDVVTLEHRLPALHRHLAALPAKAFHPHLRAVVSRRHASDGTRGRRQFSARGHPHCATGSVHHFCLRWGSFFADYRATLPSTHKK